MVICLGNRGNEAVSEEVAMQLQEHGRAAGRTACAALVAAGLVANGSAVAAASPAQGLVHGAEVHTVAAQPSRSPLLVRGMRGSEVERWQEALDRWLVAQDRPSIATDGIFGPQTEAATRQLQRHARIAVDGIVGPQTRGALARLTRGDAAPFEGTIGLAEAAPVPGRIAVTGVRFGKHETFDRVVYDLAGTGHAGWRVRYVDSPVRAQGSGFIVPLEGDAQLSVALRGIALPGDAGGRRYDGPQRPKLGATGVVEDLYVGNVYEGVFESFVGTRSPERVRVFRLDDPKRVVVDIAHGS